MAKQIMTIVRGEPFLSRVKAYHEDYLNVVEQMGQFSISVGAERFWCFPGSNKLSFKFKRDPGKLRNGIPEGFSSPDRRTGITSPKKKTAIYEQMLQLPLLPTTKDCFEGIPRSMNYVDNVRDLRGSTSLYNKVEAYVGWLMIDGEFMYFMEIPDVAAAKASMLEQYEDAEFEDEINNWKIPEGLEAISDKKYKYLNALAELQEEEKSKTEGVS